MGYDQPEEPMTMALRRGGIGLPVKVVGVGVRVDDPRPVDPEDFGCPLVYS
jgi:hypothetical protein